MVSSLKHQWDMLIACQWNPIFLKQADCHARIWKACLTDEDANQQAISPLCPFQTVWKYFTKTPLSIKPFTKHTCQFRLSHQASNGEIYALTRCTISLRRTFLNPRTDSQHGLDHREHIIFLHYGRPSNISDGTSCDKISNIFAK